MLRIFIVLFNILLLSFSHAQDTATVLSPASAKAYIDDVNDKANSISKKLGRESNQALSRFQKQEARLRKKLAKVDSLAAKSIFDPATEKYKQLAQGGINSKLEGNYIPSLDTMLTSIKLFKQNPQLFESSPAAKQKFDEALKNVNALKDQFQNAAAIREYIKKRKEFLKAQLSKFGLAKDLKKLNKEVYYYSQQVNEYKSLLKDKKKREQKALSLLRQTKLFKDFMRKNSLLASMFRMPGDIDPASSANLGGLQTRAQISSQIQQQISSGGPNGMQQFQQNVQQAQAKLQELRNKFTSMGSGSSEDILPEGFKPNTTKTKRFWDRLEYGTNIQTSKNNGWFPVTSDIALSLGYKLNDKSVIGIGGSYKLGWGKDLRHIDISHQGIGLRSFIDLKLKGSFWITGGYERNYRSEFNNIAQLKELNAWQQSGLIGLSKTVSIKSKFFKKTKLQLLWDFLSYQQVPQTQPLVFRLGYSIN